MLFSSLTNIIHHWISNDFAKSTTFETFNFKLEIGTRTYTFVPTCTSINNDIIFQAFSTKAAAESRRSREQWIFQPRLEFVQARKDRSKFSLALYVARFYILRTADDLFSQLGHSHVSLIAMKKRKQGKNDTRQITKQIEPAVIYRALIQRYTVIFHQLNADRSLEIQLIRQFPPATWFVAKYETLSDVEYSVIIIKSLPLELINFSGFLVFM